MMEKVVGDGSQLIHRLSEKFGVGSATLTLVSGHFTLLYATPVI